MSMRDEIKPCPFCGRKASLYTWHICNEYHVRCSICNIGTDDYKTPEEAVQSWNKRCPNEQEVQFYTFISNLASGYFSSFDDAVSKAQNIIAEVHYD